MARSRSTFGRVYRRKGREGFYVRVRLHGREVTRWAGPDRKIASEFLAQLLRTNAREDLLGEKVVGSTTFRGIMSKLLAHLAAVHGSSTVRGESGRWVAIEAWFGDRPLRDVTPGVVQEFLTSLRTNGLAVSTVNRYASALAVAFKFAVDKGLAKSNPVAGLKRAREDRKAIPFVSSADVDRLIAAHADPAFRAYLRVLADSGLRRSEAIRLEWRDVDLRRKVLLVRRSKTHEPREVPMTGAVHGAFKALAESRKPLPMKGADPVWPTYAAQSIAALTRRFDRLAKRTGFDGLTLHALRHGFCSRLAQVGVPIPTVAALAGHRCIATTMRYAGHLPDGATTDAIKRLEAPVKAELKAEGDRAGDQAVPAVAKPVALVG